MNWKNLMYIKIFMKILIILLILSTNNAYQKRRDNKAKCPQVKAIRNFDLPSMMGFWYVVQYYASSEDLSEYACMRSIFTTSLEDQHVTMNFTYKFSDDPNGELLQGNITWLIPNFEVPAHWIHTESFYEGIYNTYVIDTDYKSWGLIMHCAEKNKSPRYLSALLLSREPTLGINVINFLREKLPRYDIDTSFMFSINQTNCNGTVDDNVIQNKKNEYIIETSTEMLETTTKFESESEEW